MCAYRMVERLRVEGRERLPLRWWLSIIDELGKQCVREEAFCLGLAFFAYV